MYKVILIIVWIREAPKMSPFSFLPPSYSRASPGTMQVQCMGIKIKCHAWPCNGPYHAQRTMHGEHYVVQEEGLEQCAQGLKGFL